MSRIDDPVEASKPAPNYDSSISDKSVARNRDLITATAIARDNDYLAAVAPAAR